ncbi:MAG: hypothetical protein VZQ47_09320 [Treponema sp.]|nr:hypothetical protein [Treponema sp.]
MKKVFLLCCVFSIFFAGLLAAQTDSSKDAAQENSSQEKSSPKKRLPTIKEKVKEVTEGVKEYRDKMSEEQKDRPVQSLQFLGDFFTDKLPLTLDFGAEPGDKESTIFASLQYDWTERFSSRLRFEYNSLTDIENISGGGYTKNSKKNYGFILLPGVWYFGDADVDAKTPLFSLGAGVCYSFAKANIYSCAPYGSSLATSDTDTFYHTLSPVFIATVQVPFKKYFVFGSETALMPIAYLHIDWDMKVAYSGSSKSGTFAADMFSSPAVEQILYLDIFKFVRIKTSFKYSRMALSQNHYYSSTGAALTGKYVSHNFVLRYGAEFVLPSSNRTRKKNAHLWAGVYYQHTWQFEDSAGKYSSDYKGRWVLCFGK